MSRRGRVLGTGTRTAGERGSALLELALALPIVLALIGAIIDGGWALHQAALVTAAAEAAQRAVAIEDTGTGHCTGAPTASYGSLSAAAAAAAAPTLSPSGMSIALRYAEPACTGRMRTLIVDVTYTLRALTPWFAALLNGRRLTAEAGAAVEELPPPWWGSAGQVQSDQAQIQAQQSQVASQQAQLASLTWAYQAVLSAYQAASSAYQAEASLASALSQSAAYYYAQWQQLATQGAADGTHEQ
ncbi:MAG TPA: TadE/TadG family type IV pilus assembly protein [bacterium]|nr:TadE/TadG family type IV pilus assembly protein [bacterium]